jgi:anti-anti-sigma factor
MDYLLSDAPAGAVLLVFASRKRRGARVALVGDLDVTAVRCLQDWVRSFTAGRPPGTVRLDLSDLRFVDAAGLRALAVACTLLEKRCASVELAGLPGSTARRLRPPVAAGKPSGRLMAAAQAVIELVVARYIAAAAVEKPAGSYCPG